MRLARMVRAGLSLNLVGARLVALVGDFLVGPLLGLDRRPGTATR